MKPDSPASAMFAKLAKELAKEPEVELANATKKGFGSGTLKVHGKIFAMVTSAGHFVVKLPRERVAELVASGKGSAFDPGHGRIMKEWFQAGSPDLKACRSLAKEALRFVRG